MGWHLDGRATACVGTHTHVPTADARVLPGGTAYITDVGMTGPRGGVIGVKRELALERFLTFTNVRFETSDEDPWLNALLVEADGEGRRDGRRAAPHAGGAVAPARSGRSLRAARGSCIATSAIASGSRATHVEVVRRELDLGEDRGQRRHPRERVQPPGESERAEGDQPDEELRREDLAQEREARRRRRGRRSRALVCPRPPRAHSSEHARTPDSARREQRGDGVRGGMQQAVRAIARHAPRLAGPGGVQSQQHQRRRALDLHRTVELEPHRIRRAARRHGQRRAARRPRSPPRRPARPASLARRPRATSHARATGTATSGKRLRHHAQPEHRQPRPRTVAAQQEQRRPAGAPPGTGRSAFAPSRPGAAASAPRPASRAAGPRPSRARARRRAARRPPPRARVQSANAHRKVSSPGARRGQAALSPAPRAAGTRRPRPGMAARRRAPARRSCGRRTGR